MQQVFEQSLFLFPPGPHNWNQESAFSRGGAITKSWPFYLQADKSWSDPSCCCCWGGELFSKIEQEQTLFKDLLRQDIERNNDEAKKE